MAKIPIAHKQDIKYPCLATWAKNAHSINTHWWIDWAHATSFIPFLSVPKGHALDVSRSDDLCLSRLSPNIQVTASASNTFWEFCRNWWHHCLQAVLSFQRKPCHQQRNWIWASAYACSGHQNLPGTTSGNWEAKLSHKPEHTGKCSYIMDFWPAMNNTFLKF